MEGEKGTVFSNGGASAGSADASANPGDGINTLENHSQVYYSDVEEEELSTPKETNGSHDTIKALEEEIRVLRRDNSELQHRMGEMKAQMESSEDDRRSLVARISELEEEIALSKESNNIASSKVDSICLLTKTLEMDKSVLESCIRDLEARLADLQSENAKVVADSLEKDAIVNSMKDDLIIEREKANTDVKKKDEEIIFLSKQLKLNEDEIKSLKEELNTSREKARNEIETLKEYSRVAATQHEEMSVTLKEELRLTRENARDQLEIEKKKIDNALEKKEREVISQLQELVINKIQANNMDVVADKEAEIFLVKDHLSQAIVNARIREEDLERELKQLKDKNFELEEKIKGLQINADSDAAVHTNMGTDTEGENEGNESRFSWIALAATVASTGTVAAAVTAFCLRRNNQS